MAPFFFKLSDPSTKRTANVSETPSWLEEHFSHVNSDNSEEILGKVDTSLIKAEPEANNPSTFYGSDNNALVYSYTQNPAPGLQWSARTQSDQNFWENTEDGFTNGFSLTAKVACVEKPINSKQFCDDIYMRLMNVFFVITDEKQVAKTQAELIQVLHEIENTFNKK